MRELFGCVNVLQCGYSVCFGLNQMKKLCVVMSIALLAGCSTDTVGSGQANATEDELPDVGEEARDVSLELVHLRSDFDPSTVSDWLSIDERGVGMYAGECWAPEHNDGRTYDYSECTREGQACAVALAVRMQAILQHPPQSLLDAKEREGGWDGSFYNWVNDYGGKEVNGTQWMRSFWWWNVGLAKWVGEANNDGTCFLPTYEHVDYFATTCLLNGNEGCRGKAYPAGYTGEPSAGTTAGTSGAGGGAGTGGAGGGYE